jgi:hypothetical protein
MSAGSIVVDLLMRTGSFVTDTARAAKQLKAFQKDVVSTAGSIKTQLVGALATAGVALSFDALVQGAAKFKDLEEETGATAEDLASLAVVAATAGVEIDSIAAAAIKLTKNLSGVDDESKAAGAALTALGIPIQDFKKLDPVAQIDALSKAFNSFADGPQKSAVALALFGKAGAEQLKVFKALDEAGGRTVILTQAQIELADAYADRQAKLTATLKAYAQVAVTDLLPSLNELTQVTSEVFRELVGVDSAGKKLAGDSPIKEFAESAANVFAFLADSVQGVGRVVQTLGIYFGSAGAAAAAVLSGEFQQARTIAEEARQDIDKVLSAELFSQRLARLRAAAATAAASGDNQSAAESARLARKPRLEFDGTSKRKPGGTGDKQSEAQKYLETLQKSGEQVQKLTDYEKALNDIQSKRLKGITPALERSILEQAKANDQARVAIELRTAEVGALSARAKAELDNLDALVQGNKELEREIALIGLDELGILGVERARISSLRALKEEELARRAANGAADETLQVLEAEIAALREREELIGKKIGRSIENRNDEAVAKAGSKASTALADSIEAGILDGYRKGSDLTTIFLNELKAQFAKTVLRPLIEPVAAAGNDLIGQLIGSAVSAFAGGGLGITTGDSAFSQTGAQILGRKAGGGDANPNPSGVLLVGEKGPELFRPSTSGRIIPNGMLGNGGAPRTIIENHGARIQEQRQSNGDVRFVIDAAVREVDRRIASRTGSTAVALKSAGLSLNRGLPRRGGV